MTTFYDRQEAGRQLARYLMRYAGDCNTIVLALPRGGVPVAYEVAAALRAPLDIYIVRKLGAPGHEELAIGALAADGSCVVDEAAVRYLGVSPRMLEEIVQRELLELKRRELAYRGNRPEPDVRGKTVVVVDDGLATGATMTSVVRALRQKHPAKIIVAVPVGSQEAVEALGNVADGVIAVDIPHEFLAVGHRYRNFSQTSDEEVRELLERARKERASWNAA